MSVASITQNPFLLTLPQVLSGRKKLALVAAEYDVEKSSLHAFQTRALTPTQFREQLRRLFALQLTDSELGGLVALFDKDGVGMVDCTTFLNEFFRLGRIEKSRQVRDKLKAQQEYEERRARKFAQVQQRYEQSVQAEVAEFDSKDMRSAEKKLARVARYYDPGRHGLLSTMTPCAELNPTEFKARLWNSFNIKLTARELGALVHAYDRSTNGCVNLTDFLIAFYRLGREARQKEHRRLKKIRQQQDESNKRRLEKQSSQQETQIKPALLEAREQDRASAVQKLNEAARMQVDPAVLQQAFQTKSLDAWEFREQLKLVFGIWFSLRELSAVLELFDRNGDGTIDSAEFLFTFSYIGNRERAKMQREAREANSRRGRRRERFKKQIEEKFVAMTNTNVVWPQLPSVVGVDGGGGGGSMELLENESLQTKKSAASRNRNRQQLFSQDSIAESAVSLKHVTDDTRKFLEEIEREEAALGRIGSTRRTARRKRKARKAEAAALLPSSDDYSEDEHHRLHNQQHREGQEYADEHNSAHDDNEGGQDDDGGISEAADHYENDTFDETDV